MKRKSLFALLMALVILSGALPTAASAADSAPALRSEAVVCLWEAAGSPAPSRTEAPFTDVALSAPGRGVYVAYELASGEAEGADYTLETDAQGRTVLTLMAADGTIRYVKRAG